MSEIEIARDLTELARRADPGRTTLSEYALRDALMKVLLGAAAEGTIEDSTFEKLTEPAPDGRRRVRMQFTVVLPRSV